MKKEKQRLKKLKLSSEAFNIKVTPEDIYLVKKVLGKLIDHNHESINELPQLFEMLDQGFEIDLSGLSDTYVMQKLNKVFKSLKLKRDEKNKLEFRKREGIHDFKLKTLIQHFIDEIVGNKDEENKSSDSEGDSSSEQSDSDSDRGAKKRKRSRSRSFSSDNSSSSRRSRSSSSEKAKPKMSKLDALNNKINQIQYKTLEAKKDSSDESDDDIGPKFESGKVFLDSTLNLI